ncbi:MAG: hypothetical protein ABR543_19005 [Gemmatimonadaceae bacterium]
MRISARPQRLFKFWPLFAILAGMLPASAVVHAQKPERLEIRIPDTANVQILKTRDGSTLIGRVTKVATDTIHFQSNMGPLKVARANIAELREVPASRIKNGKLWLEDPNATRLFLAPTGRMLGKGEGYFSSHYLFFLGGAAGVTDNFTIGGGLSVFPADDFTDNILYLTPKVGIVSKDRINVALGALIGFAGFDDGGSFGIGYGVATLGSRDHSLTGGVGLGYADADFADDPMFMFGGQTRISRRAALVTENYYVPSSDGPVVSYGVRFFGERMAVDLAFINVFSGDAIFPGIPYIDFTIHF